MKNITLLFIFISLFSYSQNGYREINDTIHAELYADVIPKFSGGDTAFTKYVTEKIVFPAAKTDKAIIGGSITASFIVASNGKVSDVQIEDGFKELPELDKELKRILSSMPKWSPAKKDGGTVNFSFSATFMISYTTAQKKLALSILNISQAQNEKKSGDDAYNSGVRKMDAGDFSGAILDFTMALKLNAEDIDALFNRAAAKLKLYDANGACEDWNKIKSLGKPDADDLIKRNCTD
jgi:hypothetical protein